MKSSSGAPIPLSRLALAVLSLKPSRENSLHQIPTSFLLFLCLGLLFFLPCPSHGATEPSPSSAPPTSSVKVVTLDDALHLALTQGTAIRWAQNKIAKAEAIRSQARAGYFPKAMGTITSAPIYKATGDPMASHSDFNTWGVWLSGQLTLAQPLYTWGRLSSFSEAAQENEEVQRAALRGDRAQIEYEVKEVYYGSIATELLFQFLEDGRKELNTVLSKAEEDQLKPHPKIPKRDVFRLKVFAAEAEYRWQEASKMRELARHLLGFRMGLEPGETAEAAETSLLLPGLPPPSQEDVFRALRQHRPELAQLEHGIKAKQALLSAERAMKMPMLFFGGMITSAYSNVRNTQSSPFAFDPYNRSSGGIGLGIQWNFDLMGTLANEQVLKVEIEELQAQQAMASSGLVLEARKALADLVEAQKNVIAAEEAFKVGRKWLTSETMGQTLGLGDMKDLIDAYLARAKTAKDLWSTQLQVLLCWARLEKTVGAAFWKQTVPAGH